MYLNPTFQFLFTKRQAHHVSSGILDLFQVYLLPLDVLAVHSTV